MTVQLGGYGRVTVAQGAEFAQQCGDFRNGKDVVGLGAILVAPDPRQGGHVGLAHDDRVEPAPDLVGQAQRGPGLSDRLIAGQERNGAHDLPGGLVSDTSAQPRPLAPETG